MKLLGLQALRLCSPKNWILEAAKLHPCLPEGRRALKDTSLKTAKV
jgi:hypothetical protein